jgi:hypothetical protein
MAIDIENTEEGLYWAQMKSGLWMIIEIDKRYENHPVVWPVYPWHERYRCSLIPEQFTLGERIIPPGPMK